MTRPCGSCGNQVPDSYLFCPQCGGHVGAGGSTPGEGQTVRRAGATYGRLDLENLPAGHLIDDRYDIVRKLGQGGFGAVYLVTDRKMSIEKALKVIPQVIVNDIEAMSDLRNEARTMVSLNHPGIVRVFDLHDTGTVKYIDMEYIRGRSLSQLKLERPEKKLPEAEVIRYAVQVANAMAYAHSNNVLHRDLKPHNIMVDDGGRVKVMDFGIAETVRSSMTRLTGTSSSGTLVYMSPEQLRGKQVGKESDIYSFAAMLYELLSGHPPFYRGDVQFQILNETPEPIEGVSAPLQELIHTCLAKDYRERMKGFGEVADRLERHTAPLPKERRSQPRRTTPQPVVKKPPPLSTELPPKQSAGQRFLAGDIRLEMADETTCILIPARTRVPCRYEEAFVVERSRDKYVEFHLQQGSSESASGNESLCLLQFDGVKLNAQESTAIRLALEVDREGALSSRITAYPGKTSKYAPVRVRLENG